MISHVGCLADRTSRTVAGQMVWKSLHDSVGDPTLSYLRQGGYVFVVVCLSVCLFATLRKNFRNMDLHEIFREDWQWTSEQTIKF